MMNTQTHNSPTKSVEEARQGERKKGMPTVLSASTIAAAIGLFAVLGLVIAMN